MWKLSKKSKDSNSSVPTLLPQAAHHATLWCGMHESYGLNRHSSFWPLWLMSYIATLFPYALRIKLRPRETSAYMPHIFGLGCEGNLTRYPNVRFDLLRIDFEHRVCALTSPLVGGRSMPKMSLLPTVHGRSKSTLFREALSTPRSM